MFTIYLVRHGEPAIGFGKKHICLGQKDLPLSHEGEKQVQRLAGFFKGKHLQAIYSSPLTRCRRTAEILRNMSGHKELEILTEDGLMEMALGAWDGLSFAEIRERYPVEYEERGKQIGSYRIPGGESFEEAGRRFAEAVAKLIKTEIEQTGTSTEEVKDRNILIIAHAGVIRAYLCMLLGISADCVQSFRIPYASLTVLRIPEKADVRGENGPALNESEANGSEANGSGANGSEENGSGASLPADNSSARLASLSGHIPGTARSCQIESIGLRPVESISLSEVDRIWAECRTPSEVRAHMEMVADTAMNCIGYDFARVSADIFDTAYSYQGAVLNTRVIYYAALLHDIFRANGRGHEANGADFLRKQGYLELEDAVRMHNDPNVWKKGEPLTEAELVYYADKLVKGERLVAISERFAASREKCKTPEAIRMHERRYEAALEIEKKL